MNNSADIDASLVTNIFFFTQQGRIVTTTRLDAEKQSVYHFMVVAVNKRDPQHQAEAGVCDLCKYLCFRSDFAVLSNLSDLHAGCHTSDRQECPMPEVPIHRVFRFNSRELAT